MNVIEILKTSILEGDKLDVYSLPKIVINWPDEVEPEEEDEFWEEEPQDLENYEILELTKDKMVICCGGDWQQPMTFTLKPDKTGLKLEASNYSYGDYVDGLSTKEILKILSK